VHGGIYHQNDLFEDDENTVARCSDFIQLQDIRRIEKAIKAETVCLHLDDSQSVLQWVERLRAQDALLGFKAKSDPPPSGSDLDPGLFLRMIQTTWQGKKFKKYGQYILCINETHNVAIYEKLLLTTLVVRDQYVPQPEVCVPTNDNCRFQAFRLQQCWHRMARRQQFNTSSKSTT
jgi:hypothetical protein